LRDERKIFKLRIKIYNWKMMPSATTNLKQTMKPKIGFSIESIVGGVRKRSSGSFDEEDVSNNYMPNSPKLLTSANNQKFNEQYSMLIKRARRCVSPNNIESSHARLSRESSADRDNKNNNNNSKSDNKNLRNDSQSRSPSPVTQKAPILVPGIPAGLIRPPILPPQQLPAHYPPDGHNPHLLAQFQAIANAQAAQIGFNGHLPQHLPPHLHNPNLPRESYPLYPWLLSRHGRLFPHRFPGSE
jgi:homeobox protein EMX